MNTVFRLLSYTKNHKVSMALALFGTLGYSALNLAAPNLLRQVTAIFSAGKVQEQTNALLWIALALFVIYTLRAFMLFCRNYFGHKLAWRITGDVRVGLFAHMEKLSMQFFHNKQTGQLMSRVISDTAYFENLLAHALPDFITNIIILIGVCAILLTINPLLTLFSLIPFPLLIAASWVFIKKVRPEFRRAQAVIGDFSAQLQDSISGIREIQSFNQQTYEEGRVKAISDRYGRRIVSALKKSAIFHPSVELFSSLGTVLIIAVCAVAGASLNVPVADIVGFMLYLGLFYTPISTFARLIEDIQQSTAGAERVFALLDTPPDIFDRPGAVEAGRLQGNIAFSHVNFSYIPGQPVLHDLSFTLPAGKMLALVGPTGVGKTTVSNLLCRFYEPDSGSITIDGHNIAELTLASLRSQISMVMQDVFLFNGTVEENIAYGNKNATPEQVEQAARTACAHEFIMQMPEGYKTYIGERGVKLSGGQKQRLSIARAVLRNTPVLIMDEATSSVDTETENHIRQAVDSLMGHHTMLVIAHRLSTVRRADWILVLENGVVKEQGTHELLLAAKGLYAQLCRAQLHEE